MININEEEQREQIKDPWRNLGLRCTTCMVLCLKQVSEKTGERKNMSGSQHRDDWSKICMIVA